MTGVSVGFRIPAAEYSSFVKLKVTKIKVEQGTDGSNPCLVTSLCHLNRAEPLVPKVS